MDYTFDRQLELERDEARQEGWADGKAEERANAAEAISMHFGVSIEEALSILDNKAQ